MDVDDRLHSDFVTHSSRDLELDPFSQFLLCTVPLPSGHFFKLMPKSQSSV